MPRGHSARAALAFRRARFRHLVNGCPVRRPRRARASSVVQRGRARVAILARWRVAALRVALVAHRPTVARAAFRLVARSIHPVLM